MKKHDLLYDYNSGIYTYLLIEANKLTLIREHIDTDKIIEKLALTSPQSITLMKKELAFIDFLDKVEGYPSEFIEKLLTSASELFINEFRSKVCSHDNTHTEVLKDILNAYEDSE